MADPYIGEIRLMPYTYAPEDWFDCSGQTLLIQQYTPLFAVIGIRFGGDGQTNFKLPDLRGLVPVGTGAGPGLTARTIAQTWGSTTVTLNETTVPPHTHGMSASTTNTNLVSSPVGAVPAGQQKLYAAPGSNTPVPLAATVTPVGGAQAHNNMAPFTALRFCICWNGTFPVKP
ncbi:phage tail protein [Caenispirillum bisanense]|uniref:Microcystin-dependent protein n=1 Tax=Caenispirillum bisanense TaxID=414052 RepID=A0A286G5H1_9PROT|nr:tail fiber protein [Caenispirillum bisanense]SOD90748.1 Microcystin-dependent protein [Caenispirillum bisanense]